MESIDTSKSLLGHTLHGFKGRKGAIENKVKLLNRSSSGGVKQMLKDIQWMLNTLDEKAAEVVRSVSNYPLYPEIHYIHYILHYIQKYNVNIMR